MNNTLSRKASGSTIQGFCGLDESTLDDPDFHINSVGDLLEKRRLEEMAQASKHIEIMEKQNLVHKIVDRKSSLKRQQSSDKAGDAVSLADENEESEEDDESDEKGDYDLLISLTVSDLINVYNNKIF